MYCHVCGPQALRETQQEVEGGGSSVVDRRVPTSEGPELLAASHWPFHWSGPKWSRVRRETRQRAASGAEATLNGSVVLFLLRFSCFRPLLKS